MTDHARLRALAGITEAPEVMDADDVLDADYAAMEAREKREKRIVGIIRQVLDRIGFPYDQYERNSVMYSEESDREATVDVMGDIEVSVLVQLQNSGLARSYKVSPGKYDMTVTFAVDSSFDGSVTMAEADGTKRFWKAV